MAATLVAGSCKRDPLSDLDNNPAMLIVDFSELTIGVGNTATVTASVLDGRATRLEIPVEFTACNSAVTVGSDTSYHPVPATSSRAIITAQTPAPSCVVVMGAGLTDTVNVCAVPTSFTGALSSTTPMDGDTLVIASTAQLKFDSGATAHMIVGTGGNNSAVCPEVVLGNATPATNDNSTGPCMLFRFDVADTMTVRFRADWDGTTATDIDIYVCADTVVSVANFGANCFEDGGGGATGVKPQTTSSAQFTAGSHWLVIELFGGPTPANNYVTIPRQPY